MNIEEILQNIATDKDKTVEEIRNSNIQDIFPMEEFDEQIGYVNHILPLVDYIEKSFIGDDSTKSYSVDIRHDEYSAGVTVEIHLQKKLVDAHKDMGGHDIVSHSDNLTAEVIGLDGERGFDDTTFIKIGDILNRFKQVYDKIETYKKNHMNKNSDP